MRNNLRVLHLQAEHLRKSWCRYIFYLITSHIIQSMITGYDKSRFPQLAENQSYDCIICSQVVREPKQCSKCGTLYCGACIDQWLAKSNSCLNRCPDFVIGPIFSVNLQQLYSELIIKCEKCDKGIKLANIVNHEIKCNGNKCWNHEICGVEKNKEISEGNCSKVCQVLRQLLQTKRNLKQMYFTLLDFQPQPKYNVEASWLEREMVEMEEEIFEFYRPKLEKASNSSPSTFEKKQKTEMLMLKWEIPEHKKVHIQKNGSSFICEEANYFSKSVATHNGFMEGKHYWELRIYRSSENSFLTGVTKRKVQLNSSFSDKDNSSFLIQSEKIIEAQLGRKEKSAINSSRVETSRSSIGVCLNMNKGTLCFSWNKKKLAIKIQNEHLKSGPLFPAILFSYEIECEISGEFQIPEQFQDD